MQTVSDLQNVPRAGTHLKATHPKAFPSAFLGKVLPFSGVVIDLLLHK